MQKKCRGLTADVFGLFGLCVAWDGAGASARLAEARRR